MRLSRIIYDDGIDNDIIDDQSIIEGTVQENRIKIRGNEYQSLVFGAQTTIRLSVLEKAWEFVQNGGVVIFYGQLPTASVENGRQDPQVASLLHKILGTIPDNNNQELVTNYSAHNGFAAFLPDTPALIPSLISSHINRDFIASGGNVFISHRKIGDLNLYLLQNTENNPIQIKVRFRADGVPELWDPFSGDIKHMTNVFRAALNHNGFAFVEILQVCTKYNKATPQKWYWDRVKYVEDLKKYDARDISKAKEIAESFEKEIYLGVLFKNSNKLNCYEAQLNRKNIKSSPINEVKHRSITKLLTEFR